MAKVEQRMALVDALETQLTAARATAANLLTALVRRTDLAGCRRARLSVKMTSSDALLL